MAWIKYWDTYDRYPQHVIVMPAQYMFIGYENSARVISYLLDIKLIKSQRGLMAATPEIDKIISELNNHRINYIFLQHGQIADSNTFTKNNFDHYLELSHVMPIYDYNPLSNKYDILEEEQK